MPTATTALNGAEHASVEKAHAPEADVDLPVPAFTTMIDYPDANFQSAVAAVYAPSDLPPSDADPDAFGEWLERVGSKVPRRPLAERFRPEVRVKSEHVEVTYGEGERYGIRVHEPELDVGEKEGKRPALMYYHGGGWIHGSAEFDNDVGEFFASELRAVVFNVDYRLCTSTLHFPMNHNDCYHALGWVVANADKYNVDTNRVALWGSSAGGNLAAGVALRDAMEHNPSRVMHMNLVVPVTCDTRRLPPPLSTKLDSVPAELLAGFMHQWFLYTGTHTPSTSPYISPLLSPTPAHHCPVHIAVAGQDLLREEGILYALHLRDRGIDVQLEVVPGVPHGFNLAPEALVSRRYFRNQARVLNVAFYPPW